MRYRTTVATSGRTATGLPVPDDVLAALGGGRRPAVAVTVGATTYRTTVGSMGGRAMLPLSAENRAAAGVAGGDEVEVDVVLDTAPREVELPEDLAAAVAADPAAQTTLEGLAPSQRKEWVRWVTEAKREQTRTDRVARAVEALREGRRTR